MSPESLLSENLQLKEQLAAQSVMHAAQLAEREREIEKLRGILHNANRKQYVKKSEKLSSEQRALFCFEPLAELPEKEVAVTAHKRVCRGRKPLPANLPRERREYEPENCVCPCCGKEMPKIGEEITEELDYVPARFRVIEHVKIKRACPGCKTCVATGELPASTQPLERSRPGAGLLAHIILGKYVDHLPLFRQEDMFLRQGIELRRQRMCDWLGRLVDEYLERLWRELKAETLAKPYVQADETLIKVRDLEVLKTAEKLFTGYFWAVHAPPNLAFFEYHATRASSAAKEVLEGFRGIVQTDAYAGYNPVLLPDKVTRLACMAHIRRKFIEARSSASKEYDRVLVLIAKLYHLESCWQSEAATERTRLRELKARPVFAQLYQEISDIAAQLLPQHALQKALRYAISQRGPMEIYLSDGKLKIDNNPVEGRIRPIALGRKNYLFAGSHDWLTDVIRRIPSHPVNQLAELLPHRWKAA